MTPVKFREANHKFSAPADLDESQVFTIDAYKGKMTGGNLDGSEAVIVAWKPSEEELAILKRGGLVYLTVLGGLPPHLITTSFQEATMQ